jgi:3-deoxy-manno-octulosonate cytidylyltransferase (CMP-KDO synthetase)
VASISKFIEKSRNHNAIGVSLIKSFKDLKNEAVVKTIHSNSFRLLYATRKLNSNNRKLSFYRHIGIYSFLADTIKIFENKNCFILYKNENIEIFKLLEYDVNIKCVTLDYDGFAIDTLRDYKKLKKMELGHAI